MVLAMYGVGMVVGALLATRVMKARLRHCDRAGPAWLWAASVMVLTIYVPSPLLAALLLPARVARSCG
jgi:predicted MFS family arabinose efflux permease